MADVPDKPEAPETTACRICRKEVLLSEAFTTEPWDGVLYFCGIECFDQCKERLKRNWPKTGLIRNSNNKSCMYR